MIESNAKNKNKNKNKSLQLSPQIAIWCVISSEDVDLLFYLHHSQLTMRQIVNFFVYS